MALKYNFRVLTHSADELNVQSAKLGSATTKDALTDKDIGKPVKMGKQGNFELCGDDDAIDGFIDNIDAGPTEDKMTFGGVARGKIGTRIMAYVSGSADVLDYVVAAANTAEDTKPDHKYGEVKKADDGQGANKQTNWRIIAFMSDGESGEDEPAVLERC